MRIIRTKDALALGEVAAELTAAAIEACIREKGRCRLVLSTGQSQFTTLTALVQKQLDWSAVQMFHLDEYMDLPITHAASFRNYLAERFVGKVNLGEVFYVDGTAEGMARLNEEVRRAPLDIGLIGIGENGHIAFNDPPADFAAQDPYIVVALSDTCKRQQVREGWFPGEADVPKQAVSMSVQQIMRIGKIISCVPYASKAWAIAEFAKRPEDNMLPATILKRHPDYTLLLDGQSSAALPMDKAAHWIDTLEAYELYG